MTFLFSFTKFVTLVPSNCIFNKITAVMDRDSHDLQQFWGNVFVVLWTSFSMFPSFAKFVTLVPPNFICLFVPLTDFSRQTVQTQIRCCKMPIWSGSTLFALYIEGWAQDYRKSDDCFSPNLISSPWRRYEDYNISFCKQWKFRCHCSYEQWHLNLHCLQRGRSCP